MYTITSPLVCLLISYTIECLYFHYDNIHKWPYNLLFVILHGNGTMNTLLTLGDEIIGENVKFYLLQLQPVHSWTCVILVRAIQTQITRAQKDLVELIAEILSIQ